MKIINIKEYMPDCDYAIHLLDIGISDCKSLGEKTLLVIHGYGSHGSGGLIKIAAHSHLKKLQKDGVIRCFVGGEEWGELNENKMLITKISPETILNEYLQNLNSGVTVVLLG